MKTPFKMLATAALTALLATACQQQNQDTIRIGHIVPLTGNVAVYGNSTANGVKLAVQEINQAGGILGKQIELMIEDDKGDNTEAVNAYNKLADQKMVAYIGNATSAPTEAVAALAQQDNLPMIAPTATQASVTIGRPNVFRVCYTDPYQGQILADYVTKDTAFKRIALLKNNSSNYSDGVYQAFKEGLSANGVEIVAEESYSNQDKDFKAQLTNIKAKNPDALFIPDYYQIDALIVQQARQMGMDQTIIGPDGWDGILNQVDPSSYHFLNKVIFTNHYSMDDPSEKVQNFIKNYKDQYGSDPSAFSALSYDGVYLLKQAIEQAGALESQAIIDTLKTISFDGITGHLTFDDNHNPIKAVSIIEIIDGHYRLQQVKSPH